MVLCTNCGEQYSDVSRHWLMSDCTPPDLSNRQQEILTGLMMGDASMSNRDRDNPAIRVRMANEKYLQWLHELFKPLTTGVTEASGTGGWDTKATMYRLRWRGRAEYRDYTQWYDTGEKRFPDDLELTPTILKHWYVCDGSLNIRGVMKLTTKNESNRKEYIENLFEDHGFEVGRWDSYSLVFDAHVRDQLFEYMGSPLPGFEHKWP